MVRQKSAPSLGFEKPVLPPAWYTVGAFAGPSMNTEQPLMAAVKKRFGSASPTGRVPICGILSLMMAPAVPQGSQYTGLPGPTLSYVTSPTSTSPPSEPFLTSHL